MTDPQPARLDRLHAGVARFRAHAFPERQRMFRELADGQAPFALFITCADSRIVPSLITQTDPGELFVERNPGNIVPRYSDDATGVAASVEYAVAVLGVEHVVVCGHRDCGAVKAILDPAKGRAIPAVARWLEYGRGARERLAAEGVAGDAARLRRLTELNVLQQIEHLSTHPSVAARLREGRLALWGWIYDIETGEVEEYRPAEGRFAALGA